MRLSVAAILLAVSLAGGAASAMAQDKIEGREGVVKIVAPSERRDMETYELPLHYNARGDDDTRSPCASCAALDGDDNFMTESPPCTLSSGWASDECLAGVDRGGHSRGKYL